jgi:hypothetical protein
MALKKEAFHKHFVCLTQSNGRAIHLHACSVVEISETSTGTTLVKLALPTGAEVHEVKECHKDICIAVCSAISESK